jgi:hypothetical protein
VIAYNARVITATRLLAAALLMAAPGCTQRELGATGVRVDVSTDDAQLRPWVYQLDWLDEERRLLQRTIPDDGRLADDSMVPAQVYIQVDPRDVGPRRVVARGLRDGHLISLGAARVTAVAGQWIGVTVTTSDPSKVADGDADGIPDEVDNCPAVPDPCQGGDGGSSSSD